VLAGRIYEAAGRTAEAAAYFDAALRRNPNDPAARRHAGRLALESDPATALEHWDRYRALAPEDPLGDYFAARAHLALGDPEAATLLLLGLRDGLPPGARSAPVRRAQIELELARAALLRGNTEQARRILAELVAWAPDPRPARALLARLEAPGAVPPSP
jgi:tetratricopeptide (TPR) repeat protein